ncbi:hypothetical protein VTO42DRAFT_7063 [Malbranchea cinnamomea]
MRRLSFPFPSRSLQGALPCFSLRMTDRSHRTERSGAPPPPLNPVHVQSGRLVVWRGRVVRDECNKKKKKKKRDKTQRAFWIRFFFLFLIDDDTTPGVAAGLDGGTTPGELDHDTLRGIQGCLEGCEKLVQRTEAAADRSIRHEQLAGVQPRPWRGRVGRCSAGTGMEAID